MKMRAGMLVAFAVAAGLSLPALAQETTPAPQLPDACAFLAESAPTDPAQAGYPVNEQFRACAQALYAPYHEMEEDIRLASEKSNADMRAAIEKAKKIVNDVAAETREKIIGEYKRDHNGQISEEEIENIRLQVYMALMPYGLSLGMATPPEETKLSGCLAPYQQYRDQINIMEKYPDIAVEDRHVEWQTSELARCAAGIVERIQNDLGANAKTELPRPAEGGIEIDIETILGNAKGFTNYLADPAALATRAQVFAAMAQSVSKAAEYRSCAYFMADPDNAKHYDYIKDRPELIPEHKAAKIERCKPVLAGPNS